MTRSTEAKCFTGKHQTPRPRHAIATGNPRKNTRPLNSHPLLPHTAPPSLDACNASGGKLASPANAPFLIAVSARGECVSGFFYKNFLCKRLFPFKS